MSIRPLVILPDARLREISAPVGTITGDVRKLAADMLETMYDAPGVGLAGIQIGEAVRIVTIDTSKEKEERKPLVLLDPEIVWTSEETRPYEEGCLSIPDYYAEVIRPDRVRVRFRTLDGETWSGRPTGSSPPVSSTRSTTSTACCSSTTCRSSSATG